MRAPRKNDGPLFRPVRNNVNGTLETAFPSDSIHKIVRDYGLSAKIELDGLCLHSLRATEVTNVLEHKADIDSVQRRLGQANISTTGLHGQRGSRPVDSPTFKVNI